ncbi:hypothetical protein AX17_003266 [Amanita inopinata Kibby_2008]|nr:hypothetical protein AX17_003266 [Amanita inopinata Kibby_2008]
MDEEKFMWGKLPRHCAQYGVYIDNYPQGVSTPFSTARHHGLSHIPIEALHKLFHALRDEKVHPMSFKKSNDALGIRNNKIPVLIFAPSQNKKQKQVYLDGRHSYKIQENPDYKKER